MYSKQASGFAAAASLLALVRAQDGIPADLTGAFNPDTITLQASFGGDAGDGFSSGITFDAGETQSVPNFALGDSSGINTQVSFAVAMFDTTCDGQRTLHYFKHGFQATGTQTQIESPETPIVPYAGPGSFQETGSRTYTFLLFSQPRGEFTPGAATAGEEVDIDAFAAAMGLRAGARAGTAFKVELGGETSCGAGGEAPPAPPAEETSAPVPEETSLAPIPEETSLILEPTPEVTETLAPIETLIPTEVLTTDSFLPETTLAPIETPAPLPEEPPVGWDTALPWPVPSDAPWPEKPQEWPESAPWPMPTGEVWPSPPAEWPVEKPWPQPPAHYPAEWPWPQPAYPPVWAETYTPIPWPSTYVPAGTWVYPPPAETYAPPHETYAPPHETYAPPHETYLPPVHETYLPPHETSVYIPPVETSVYVPPVATEPVPEVPVPTIPGAPVDTPSATPPPFTAGASGRGFSVAAVVGAGLLALFVL